MEDENGAIALEALKEMRSVIRQAMARMPEVESEDEAPETEAPEEMPTEAESIEVEEESIEEPPPEGGKMTVLESFAPKMSSAPSAPPMPPKRGPGRPPKARY